MHLRLCVRGNVSSRLGPLLALLFLPAWACSQSSTPASPPSRFDPSRSDPSAIRLADSVLAGLGGQRAWDEARYIAFDFVVYQRDTLRTRRSLRWDRTTGDLRVAGTNRAGQDYVVRTRVGATTGEVQVAGAPADSATRAALLESAYKAWVNDTYWLLMPYKLKDPGVKLRDAGADSSGHERLLHLSFDNVGLTPGDQYWVHVDPASGRVTGWEMLLESNRDGRKSAVRWTDWREHGGIRLAGRRVFAEDPVEIRIENIHVAARPPAGAFD